MIETMLSLEHASEKEMIRWLSLMRICPISLGKVASSRVIGASPSGKYLDSVETFEDIEHRMFSLFSSSVTLCDQVVWFPFWKCFVAHCDFLKLSFLGNDLCLADVRLSAANHGHIETTCLPSVLLWLFIVEERVKRFNHKMLVERDAFGIWTPCD